jgi:hypothetical protein
VFRAPLPCPQAKTSPASDGKEGVWLGIKSESGESLIGTGEGVAKAMDFRRKPENGGLWSAKEFDKLRGAPWEPQQGAGGGLEVKSKVQLPADPVELRQGSGNLNLQGEGSGKEKKTW